MSIHLDACFRYLSPKFSLPLLQEALLKALLQSCLLNDWLQAESNSQVLCRTIVLSIERRQINWELDIRRRGPTIDNLDCFQWLVECLRLADSILSLLCELFVFFNVPSKGKVLAQLLLFERILNPIDLSLQIGLLLLSLVLLSLVRA